jgi:hypothetical protein
LAAGEIEQAEHYAAALAGLVPRNAALLDAVFACNVALGRKEKAAAYAAALLALDSSHAARKAFLSGDEPASKPVEINAAPEAHPLLRLRDMHDSISAILCQKLTADGIAQVEQHLKASRELVIDVPEGSEWEAWVKHYRLAARCHRPRPLCSSPTPKQPVNGGGKLISAAGVPLTWAGLQAKAARLHVKTVFFAAADRAYSRSLCEVVHQIDSEARRCVLPDCAACHRRREGIARRCKSVGIKDKRLVYSGDAFDAAAVTTKCYDTPPKDVSRSPSRIYSRYDSSP